jgi:hypothetical protein
VARAPRPACQALQQALLLVDVELEKKLLRAAFRATVMAASTDDYKSQALPTLAAVLEKLGHADQDVSNQASMENVRGCVVLALLLPSRRQEWHEHVWLRVRPEVSGG